MARGTIRSSHPIAMLAVVGLAACAAADAMPLPQARAPTLLDGRDLGLYPGESMSYDVQLAGVLVGEAQLAVGDIGTIDGHRAIIVKSRAATAGAAALIKQIVDESTTVIDIDTGRPLRVDSHVVNGPKELTATSTFSGRYAAVSYVRNTHPDRPVHLRIDFHGETVLDMHSAMAALRGWRADPGTRRTVYLIGGRRLRRIDLTYDGDTTIGSPIGNRRAVVFEGVTYRIDRRTLAVLPGKPTRTFKVWLSNDADRVPIKCAAQTELGAVTMTLVEYNRR